MGKINFGFELELNGAGNEWDEWMYSNDDYKIDSVKPDGSLDNGAEYCSRIISLKKTDDYYNFKLSENKNVFLQRFLQSGDTAGNTGLHVHISTAGLYDAITDNKNIGECEFNNFLKILYFYFPKERRDSNYLKWQTGTGHYDVLNHRGRNNHFEFRAWPSTTQHKILCDRILTTIGIVVGIGANMAICRKYFGGLDLTMVAKTWRRDTGYEESNTFSTEHMDSNRQIRRQVWIDLFTDVIDNGQFLNPIAKHAVETIREKFINGAWMFRSEWGF